MDERVLENDLLKAVFDGQTGTLIALVSKKTGWPVMRRAELGLSFRMLLPLEGRRNNPILGEKQAAPAVEQGADGSLSFTWSKLRSTHGGEHDITFTGTVSLTQYGLTFGGTIVNRSGLVIETVSWPCVGDLTPPRPENHLECLGKTYGGMSRTPIYPKFNSLRGYYGVDHPIIFDRFPSSPFTLIDSGKQGLYAACHDEKADRMVAFCCELKPGFAATDWFDTGWAPTSDELDGHVVHLEFSGIQFLFVGDGQTASLRPIVLAPYAGTWHKGADNYRAWRKTWFKRHRAPAWVKEIHSWQQFHMNSPEDELRIPYTALPELGQECARHGVKAIQLVGWNHGGQDRGNPSHDTDPRLGTWQELKDAIAKIEAMGVKMILFNKYTWADLSLERFDKDLAPFTIKDPYGHYHMHVGWGYQTPTQLMGLNMRRLVPLCPACRAWREVACREFRKSIDLGASGMLYDESQHHLDAVYCWDESHGHPVPAHIYGSGDAALEQDFHALADAVKKDYFFGGEDNYDLQFRNYHLSYFRVHATTHDALPRYVDPEVEMMIAVTGFDDRLMANRALMHRYIISYEPMNFKGRLDDFPRTLEYGKKIDALRTRYREFLWDGEYRDAQDATVKAGNQDHKHFTVFVARSGKSAVVVANQGQKELSCTVTLDSAPGTKWRAVSPEQPEPKECGGTIVVPPASVVVMLQQ